MPPSAAAGNEVVGGGGDMGVLQEYGERLEGGAVVKVMQDLQFSTADFRPVKALGNGDMGSVFLVAQRSNNAPYAMKVMNKEVLAARKNGHRAQAEKEILAAVNHPFLPVLHSHFEDEKHNFLVMNYCHGGDLNVLRQRQPEKRFSESACRFYIAEVLLALEYLHKRKIVYRDLKPENILIQSGGHVMLTDFDLSLDLSERKWTKPATGDKISSSSPVKSQKKSSSRGMKAFFACGSPTAISKKSTPSSKKGPNSRVTPEEAYIGRKRASGTNNDAAAEGPANSFVGTEEYVAPEIIWGKGHGLPVDWWTLGILLYELYYGKTPFKGVNRKETFYSVLCKPVIYPGYPNDLTDLIRRLLVKEPEERLGTKGGAEEIKKHPFFNGVNWNELQNLSRTPVVPDFFSWEQIEKDLAAKATASGKEVQTRWSFCETTDPIQEKEKDSSTQSPSGPLSLKSNNSSSYQDRLAETLMAKHLMRMDSDASTWSLEDDGSSDDTFVLDRQAEMYKQLTSTISCKEEVRLDSHDVLIEQKLFEDVF